MDAVFSSARNLRFFQQAAKGFFILALIVAAAFASLFFSWQTILYSVLALTVLAVLLLRFEWALFPFLLLLPVTERTVGIAYAAPWNFLVRSRPIDMFPFYMPFVLAALIGLALRILSGSALPGPKDFKSENPIQVPMLLLLGYGWIALLLTYISMHSMFQIGILMFNMAIFVLMLCSLREEQFHKKVMWFWVCSGIVHVMVVLGLYAVEVGAINFQMVQLGGGFEFWAMVLMGGKNHGLFVRRGNTFTTPNDTGFIMNILCAVAFGLFMAEKKRWKKWLLALIILAFASTVVITMSRAAMGAFAAMAICLLLIFKQTRKRFAILSLAVIVGIVAIYEVQHLTLQGVFFRGEMVDRISAVFEKNQAGDLDSSHMFKQRIELWKRGLKGLDRSSYAGVGVGNYKFYAMAPFGHSIYFSTLFDLGIPGLLIVLVLFFILVKLFFTFVRFQSSYLQCMGAALLGGLVSVSVHGLVDFEYNNAVLWAHLGMTVATINLVKRELAAAQQAGPGAVVA